MSGGAFDYNCFKISQFAEDLKQKIEDNHKKEENWDGYNYSDYTIKGLRISQSLIEVAGKVAYAVEWLYSGDYGEQTFREVIAKIIKELEEVEYGEK